MVSPIWNPLSFIDSGFLVLLRLMVFCYISLSHLMFWIMFDHQTIQPSNLLSITGYCLALCYNPWVLGRLSLSFVLLWKSKFTIPQTSNSFFLFEIFYFKILKALVISVIYFKETHQPLLLYLRCLLYNSAAIFCFSDLQPYFCFILIYMFVGLFIVFLHSLVMLWWIELFKNYTIHKVQTHTHTHAPSCRPLQEGLLTYGWLKVPFKEIY